MTTVLQHAPHRDLLLSWSTQIDRRDQPREWPRRWPCTLQHGDEHCAAEAAVCQNSCKPRCGRGQLRRPGQERWQSGRSRTRASTGIGDQPQYFVGDWRGVGRIVDDRLRLVVNSLLVMNNKANSIKKQREFCREVREWSGSQMADLPGVCVSGAVARAVFGASGKAWCQRSIEGMPRATAATCLCSRLHPVPDVPCGSDGVPWCSSAQLNPVQPSSAQQSSPTQASPTQPSPTQPNPAVQPSSAQLRPSRPAQPSPAIVS